MIKNTRIRRKELIKKIEEVRQAKLLTYITGDRSSVRIPKADFLFTAVAVDVLTILNKHLKKIGETDKIDLFLYTTGGGLDAPWPIVNLIRSYCRNFSVLIPFKALSAGTLICLGANEIVMSKLALLSPVDPSGHFLKPGVGRMTISVEDVFGFIKLAKEKVEITKEGSIEEILKLLTNEIPATVLGSVKRTYDHIRDLVEKLLALHLDPSKDNESIKRIVEYLTENLHSHDHFINRLEAKQTIGLTVKNAEQMKNDRNLDELMSELLDLYGREMQLEEPFNPYLFIDDKSENTGFFKRAFIESEAYTHIFESQLRVFSTKDGVRIEDKKSGWALKEGD